VCTEYIAVRVNTSQALERHLPYEITQCYLPPDTEERAPPWPQPDRPRFTFPGGMKG